MHAALVGLAQRTLVEQTFVNLEPRAIEAVYTFPLPDGAAVCGFEVVTGDPVRTGTADAAVWRRAAGGGRRPRRRDSWPAGRIGLRPT